MKLFKRNRTIWLEGLIWAENLFIEKPISAKLEIDRMCNRDGSDFDIGALDYVLYRKNIITDLKTYNIQFCSDLFYRVYNGIGESIDIFGSDQWTEKQIIDELNRRIK